jgi:putative transposase
MVASKHKTIQHQHVVGDFHELTFSCYRKMRLLTNDRWRRVLSETIEAACETQEFELVAFVFMPDHVHLLVLPTRREPDLSQFLARVKQPCSSRIRQMLEQANSPCSSD